MFNKSLIEKRQRIGHFASSSASHITSINMFSTLSYALEDESLKIPCTLVVPNVDMHLDLVPAYVSLVMDPQHSIGNERQ